MLAGKNRQKKTCCEEAAGKYGCSFGQGVASTAAGHKTPPATNAERAPFGPLQQHDADKSQRDHDVNQQKNSGHLVAFAFEGGVLAESARVWLGLASEPVSVGGAGLRSGKGTTSAPDVWSLWAGASVACTVGLVTPPPRQRNSMSASTPRKRRTCSSSWSLRWSLTQSGPRSSAACMSRVRSLLRSTCKLAQLCLSSGAARALSPNATAEPETRSATAINRSNGIVTPRRTLSQINPIRMAKIGPFANPARNSFAIRSLCGI